MKLSKNEIRALAKCMVAERLTDGKPPDTDGLTHLAHGEIAEAFKTLARLQRKGLVEWRNAWRVTDLGHAELAKEQSK